MASSTTGLSKIIIQIANINNGGNIYMKQVMVVYNPKELLGESIKVFMKDGGKFHFKVLECGADYMNGHDEEGLDLHLKVEDIDFVVV